MRKRVSNYLNPVDPEYENFRWMFALIKAWKTSSNFIKKAQTASMISAAHSDEDVSGEDEENDAQPLTTITTNQVGSPTY